MKSVSPVFKPSFSRIKLFSLASSLAVTLIMGCGGGGGKLDAPDPDPVSQGPTWTANVFEDESNFKDRCQVPRSGNFPDQAGSTLEENHWLRSWSNNTYLWYNEISDMNPANFSTTDAYFDQLRTNATTSSGQAKDKFHFTYDSEQWQQLTQSGISAGYGWELQLIATAPPRRAVIAFTEPNTPASQNGVLRGAELLEVDGVDFINAGDQASVDILNGALFPSETGETHTFKIRNVGEAEATISLVSSEIVSSPVQNVATISTANGNVGYLSFTTHIATAEEQLIDAVNQLKAANVNDLILDLRYNGGGLLAIASQLAYMIAGDAPTAGKNFDQLVFNDKHTTTNPITGETLTPTPFYTTSLGFSVNQGQALPTLDLNRVFILSTDGTCSASEAIINGLRGIDIEVILIGSTTCGKPYGFYPTDNCGTTYFTIQFSGANDKNFGDYSDGFSPANEVNALGELVTGCAVDDDYSLPLGDENEAMVATALSYRDMGSCPVATQKFTAKVESKSQTNGAAIRSMSAVQKAVILEHRLQKNKTSALLR